MGCQTNIAQAIIDRGGDYLLAVKQNQGNLFEDVSALFEACTEQDRCYISSLSSDAATCLEAVRGHWDIENSLHWVLDMAFREDHSRVRTGNAPHKLAIVRHLAVKWLDVDNGRHVGKLTSEETGRLAWAAPPCIHSTDSQNKRCSATTVLQQ